MKRAVYESLVRPLLFKLEPETAHHLALGSLGVAGRLAFVRNRLRQFQPPAKSKNLFGLNFPNPVGLAAGFDKNGVALPAWEALGFGFIEVGTVTAKAQPGNSPPRIFRFAPGQALINRLGFNNDGADIIAERLQKLRDGGRWPGVPVGINIGKSKVTPLEEAPEDYCYSFQRLVRFADYVALNVSSPNTPGLRSLQASNALAALLKAIDLQNAKLRKPIVLKISPDLSLGELRDIVCICEEEKIAGFIATNTTLDHSQIPSAHDESGGLSGQPLREKATAILRALREMTTLPIIASGGVMDAESARGKIQAGADLLQVYTGYIYRGPALLREIVTALD